MSRSVEHREISSLRKETQLLSQSQLERLERTPSQPPDGMKRN
ncbi:MAG TPA: hypothetical protein VF826_12880 [Chloroflexia bacterium]